MAANPDRQLGNFQPKPVVGAYRWRHRESYEAGIPIGKSDAAVLCEYRARLGNVTLANANAGCLPVSQVIKKAAENLAGAEIEAARGRATEETLAKTTKSSVYGYLPRSSKCCFLLRV